MSKIRRVDFSPDEWIAGTRELTMEERGAYWDVCSLIYSRGGPIADDEAWLSKALGCHVRTWRAIRARLIALGKLTSTDGQIENGRTTRELKRAEKRLKSSRNAADASAKTRREKRDNSSEINDYKEIPEAPATAADEANYQLATSNQQRKSEREPRGAPIPPDWQPTSEDRTWLMVARPDLADAQIARETETFRNHAIGNNRLGSNWSLLWRNWIIKAKGADHGHRNGHAKRGAADQEDPVTAGIRESLARRHILPGG